MKTDLAVLWSAVKELHPGYGLYCPTDSIERSYNELSSSLKDSMYEGEFINRIYPFLCNLGCGHTQLKHSVSYQPPTGVKTSHLPFEVLVRHHRAWVTTRKTTQLATGDEIISINDAPASAIIQKGFSLYCGDGHVESFKELYLSEYDGFDDACGMLYKWSAPYRVVVRTNRGVLKTVVLGTAEVSPVDNAVYIDKYANWVKAKADGDLALYFAKDNTALFEVKGLEYADTIAYGEFFDQIAKKGSKNLILDIRHNGGGDIRIVTRLLSYLADAPFSIIKDLRSRLPDPSVNGQTAFFDPERTESFKGSCIPGRKIDNWWHMDVMPSIGHPYGPNPMASSGRFTGNLFVLIDGATFSSTALFTVALKAQRKKVVFIGRETAGTEEGCNGFTIQHLTLPKSGIVVDFPWLRVISMADSPTGGRGFMPEYPVDYTPEDIVNGNDPDITKALEVMRTLPARQQEDSGN
ncbi:MAG: hypothetical protein J0H74_36770 [Chitinophagaceae bacterium]|nr:hypothetical protein [Chitinophagaceae bacterium]